MYGQLVIVKDFKDKPLLRRVCDANGSKVFVTSEKAFDLIKKGDSTLFPIGFEANDVFEYNGHPLGGKVNWSGLRKWRR